MANNDSILHGRITPTIISFSIPIIIGSLVQVMFNMADQIVLGQMAGTVAVAAVGACGTVCTLIVNFFCGLAGGAETILVPEVPLNLDDVVSKILAGTKRGKIHSIIVKAEGVPIESGQLAKELQERTGLETKVVILGYIQRGGSPTAADRLLASRMGVHAAQLLEKGVFGRAVGVSGDRIFDTNLLQALETTKPSHTDFRHICDILA